MFRSERERGRLLILRVCRERERERVVLGLDGYFLSRVTYHNITPGAARIYRHKASQSVSQPGYAITQQTLQLFRLRFS